MFFFTRSWSCAPGKRRAGQTTSTSLSGYRAARRAGEESGRVCHSLTLVSGTEQPGELGRGQVYSMVCHSLTLLSDTEQCGEQGRDRVGSLIHSLIRYRAVRRAGEGSGRVSHSLNYRDDLTSNYFCFFNMSASTRRLVFTYQHASTC